MVTPILSEAAKSLRGRPFRRDQLLERLKILNNPKITPQMATLIGNEIEKDLLRRKIRNISSEVLDEMIRDRLVDLGLAPRGLAPGGLAQPDSADFAENEADRPPGADDYLPPEILDIMAPAPRESEEEIKRKQAQKTALAFSPNALEVLKTRYLAKNERGEAVETPEELFTRVARAIAEADLRYDPQADLALVEADFYNLMAFKAFLPNSPTLMNAGRPNGQLSACFVLPVRDSMESIFDTMKQSAIIHKTGGGTGFTFNYLRPKNDVVQTTHGVSSGPVSFMRVYDAATRAIKQGGTRRGANMGILNVNHPDIPDFVEAKDTPGELSNFNISVGVSDSFMKAVEEDQPWPLVNPRTDEPVRTVSARELFWKIVHQAWKNGEPGVLFLDRIDSANPTPACGPLEATNPCGEQPLLPYEACNLGSINLGVIVENEKINWERLRGVIHRAVHFLDNVIEINGYPLPQIEETAKKNRKIGLGVMGWADMLIRLGIPYDSFEALDMAERVMGFVQKEAEQSSIVLAKKRGVFPNYHESVYAERGIKRRNATVTTIAPTGTISMIADCSSGIEPLYGVVFVKKVLGGKELLFTNPDFEGWARRAYGTFPENIFQQASESGSIADIEEIPPEIRRLYATTYDIPPDRHVRMQSAFQKHTENGVSKTVNLPESATEEDVAKVFWLAHQLGCKGLTVYRNLSRADQVLSLGGEREDD